MARLFQKVRKFFDLLDINHSGTIEPEGARAKMKTVLLATHAIKPLQSDNKDVLDENNDEIDKEAEKKVNTLFEVADVNHDKHITYEEFEEMYKKLLKAYYEPEVLELDLDRAIAALEKKKKT